MKPTSDETSTLVWVTYAIVSGAILFWVSRVLKKMNAPQARFVRPTEKPVRVESAPSGLQSDIMREGTGPAAKKGMELSVHYTCNLEDGKELDSSYKRGSPLTFKLGGGQVIEGWEQALLGAKQGEKRIVTVPAKLAYGGKGQSRVPPGATLIFEIEVVDLRR